MAENNQNRGVKHYGRHFEHCETLLNGSKKGAFIHIDRSYTLAGALPSHTWKSDLKERRATRDKSAYNETFICSDLSQHVAVYVAHDLGFKGIPSLLYDFADTGDEVSSTDSSACSRVCSKDFSGGAIALRGQWRCGQRLQHVCSHCRTCTNRINNIANIRYLLHARAQQSRLSHSRLKQ